MPIDRKKAQQTLREQKVTRAMENYIHLLQDDSANPQSARSKLRPRAKPRPKATPSRRSIPHWDAKTRTLWLGATLIKDFKVPAKNQEIVLSAFEEQGWPECIDDPLPPAGGINPKRRLHDTIIRLNRSHKHRLIRFGGNGNGLAVIWYRQTGSSRTRSAPERL